MKRPTFLRATLVALMLVVAAVANAQQSTNTKDLGKTNTKSAERAFANHSIGFIENKGQWEGNARFMADLNGMNLWVTNTGFVYNMYQTTNGNSEASTLAAKKETKNDFKNSDSKNSSSLVQAVEVNFVGASASTKLLGEDKQPGYYNYLMGNDRTKWASFVSKFNSVKVEKLYKGIDAVLYTENNQPRYDFIVAPGASPDMIAMKITGQSGLKVDDNGDLRILTQFGEIRQAGIYAYQKDMNGNNREVKCSFSVRQNGTVGFNIGSYDASRPLVIDPLVYCTYIGNPVGPVATSHDVATGVSVDAAGYAYITGFTSSNQMLIAGSGAPNPQKLGAGTNGTNTTFPTGNDPAGSGVPSITSFYNDAFVTKMDPNGAMIYMTIIASSGDDRSMDIDVENGNAYICGYVSTDSRLIGGIGTNTLPTSLGAIQPSPNRNLNPYNMGSQNLNASYQNFNATPGYCDAFVTGLNSLGTNIIYSTYLGGSYTQDGAFDIDVDGGQIYICGQTIFKWGVNLPPFSGGVLPTLPAVQTAPPALGTATNYFPTFGSAMVAFQPAPRYTAPTLASQVQGGNINGFYNVTDGFVARLNPAVNGSSQLLYGSYFGGAGDIPTVSGQYVDYVDNVSAIKVGPNQSVYITGTTIAPFLRTTLGTTIADQFPTSWSGSPAGAYAANQEDAFLLQLNTANTGGGQMEYGTMISTPNFTAVDNDEAWDLALAPQGGVYITGVTYSNNAGVIDPSTGLAFYGAGSTQFNPAYNGINYRNSFPISNRAADTRCQGNGEAFVTYVDPSQTNGNQFPYSTYIGGNQNTEWGVAIDVDDAGYVYVVGNTSSSSFPQSRIPVRINLYTAYNMFVCKFSPRLDTLCYSRLMASSNALVANAGFGATTASAIPPGQFPRVRNTIWNLGLNSIGANQMGEFTAQNGGGMDLDDARNVYIVGGRVANTGVGGVYTIPVYTNAPYPVFDAFGDSYGFPSSSNYPPTSTPNFDDAYVLKMQPSEIAVADVGNTNVCIGQAHTVSFATSGCVKSVKIELLNSALSPVWSSDQNLPTGNPRTFVAPGSVGCAGAFTTYAVSDNPLFNDLYITRPPEPGPGLPAGLIPYDITNPLINNNWEWNQDQMRPGTAAVGAGSLNDQGIAVAGTINGVESYYYGFTVPQLPSNILPTGSNGVDYLSGYRWKVTQTDIRPYPQTTVADTSDNTQNIVSPGSPLPTGGTFANFNIIQGNDGRIGYNGANGNPSGFTLVQRPMYADRLPQNTVLVGGVTYPVINTEVCIGTTGNTFSGNYNTTDALGNAISTNIRALGAGGNNALNILNYEWRGPLNALVNSGTMNGVNNFAYTIPTTGFHTLPAALPIPGTGPLGVTTLADGGLYYLDLIRPVGSACAPVLSACTPVPPTRIYVNVKMKQPVSLAVNGGVNAVNSSPCETENGDLSVTLNGDNPGVIWQKLERDGITWTTIGSSNYFLSSSTNRDTVVHSNLLGNHYDLSSNQTVNPLPVPPTTVFKMRINNLRLDDTTKYRANYFSNGPCSTKVNFAQELLLKVLPLPRITRQPLNRTMCAGSNVSFSIGVFGTREWFNNGTYSYQWRRNNQIIPGANDTIYTINSVAASDAGDYSCEVRTPCAFASVVSVDAYLVVNTAPVVTTSPIDAIACAGDNASFSVEAKGGGLNFQWKKNGVAITGANTNMLNLSNVVDTDAGTYSVEVMGQCPPSTTVSAVLTVNKSPIITLDLPATLDACDNTAAQLDVTATGGGLAYEWTKNGTVIVGQTTSSYKFNVTKADNNAKIKVTIKGGCKPDVASKECVITVKDGGAITEGPKDLELCVGNPAKFSVKATGSGITYQWKKNGVNIPGENKADLSITSVSEADAGFYTVEVTGACAITGSGPLTAKLSISKPFTITSQPTGTQNVCPGGSISFSVTVSGGKNLKYQWKKNGTALPGETKSSYSTNISGSGEAGTYSCDVTDDCGQTQTTTTATVIVGSVAAISTQPTSQIICEGGSASFSVTATGANIKYQWLKNGQVISGANSNTYSLSNLTSNESGDYSCNVKGDCGNEIASATAKLVVNKTILTSSASQVDFGAVLVDSVSFKEVSVSFRNGGNTNAIINNFRGPASTTPFTIVSGIPALPKTLLPGEEIVLKVKYVGTPGTSKDSIVISADATCPASARIVLQGTGDERVAYAALEINNSTGDVKQTNPNFVTISYNGVPTKIIESEVSSLSFTIEYNATMLAPQDPALLSQVSYKKDALGLTWAQLPLTVSPVLASGTLKSIPMNVLLGNDSVTPVRFVKESIKWNVPSKGGKVITTGLFDGSFKVKGFCKLGGLRGTDPFKGGVTKISPNPVSSTMLVKYLLDDSKDAKLKLYDMNGNLVLTQFEAAKNGNAVAGLIEKETMLDVSSKYFASGIYMLTLECDGVIDRQLVIIVK